MALGQGIGKTLESFGSSIPGLLDIYIKAAEMSDKQKTQLKKQAALEGANKIFSEFEPQVDIPSATEQIASVTNTTPSTEPSQQVEDSPEKISFERWFEAIGKVEGNNDYGAVGPPMDSGSSKGWRALGKYQIMSNLHFAKYGLDPNSQKDINRFLNTPELQEDIGRKVYREFWDAAGGDPQKATALAYGRGDDKAVPKAGGQTMPTGKEHWEKIAEALRIGTDGKPDVRNFEVRGAFSDAMKALLNDKPTKPKKGSNVFQQKLEHFMGVATPEEVEAATPMLEALYKMSSVEREGFNKDMLAYESAANRYGNAVIAAETMRFGITKEEIKKKPQTGMNSEERQRINSKLMSLRDRKDDIITTFRDWEKSGPTKRKKIEENPVHKHLFKKYKKALGWLPFVDKYKIIIDESMTETLDEEIRRLEDMLIHDIELPSPQESASADSLQGQSLDLLKYKVPREQ